MLDRITGALRRALGRVTGGKRAAAEGQPGQGQAAGQPRGGGGKGGAAAKGPGAGRKGTPGRSRKKKRAGDRGGGFEGEHGSEEGLEEGPRPFPGGGEREFLARGRQKGGAPASYAAAAGPGAPIRRTANGCPTPRNSAVRGSTGYGPRSSRTPG
jgi:hypothetical protein